MKFRPLHDRVVVRRLDAEEKTAGGIIIPDTAKEKAPRKVYGLDEPTMVGGRSTTIREQYALHNARLMRVGTGGPLDKDPSGHAALIDAQLFDISEADYNALTYGT